MPKGRGSNKRRGKHQKDKDGTVGHLKLMRLYERFEKVRKEKSESPIRKKLAKKRKEREKIREAKRKARQEWI